MSRSGTPQNRSTWPWMAAGLAVILLAMGLLRDPVPTPVQEPTPRERVARSADGDAATDRVGAKPAQRGADQVEDGDGDANVEGADAAGQIEEEAPAGNPFAVFLKRPDALTAGAGEHPPMAALDVADPAYSATVDAQQLFAPFEAGLLAAEPLTPTSYKQVLVEFKDQNMKVLKRADWLRRDGHPDDAAALMQEWGRLFDHYKAQAYGRGAVPLPEER